MSELFKCSKCQCKKLMKFYSSNPNTEIQYKCCDKCREKNKILSKKYYEANKDKISKQGKEYREANKDKIKEQSKEYRESNSDKIKECRDNSKCQHDKQKSSCHVCSTNPKNWCLVCKMTCVQHSNGKITEGYCIPCFSVKFPEIELPRRYKLKETYMVDAVKEHFPDIKLVCDKKVNDGCSLRRPDIRIEKLIYTIIIECDENKHTGYICENKRLMQLFEDLGSRPIIVIRFNPDKYTDSDGNKIQSCFNGTILRKREWKKRTDELVRIINKYYTLNEIPEKEITTEYLFY